MSSYFKFGAYCNEIEMEHRYQNNYAFESFPKYERIIVAPVDNHIELIQRIIRVFESPYYILYVLVVSRCDHDLGRYQCPYPLNDIEVNDFCNQFKKYFESDGRHHIWIGSAKTKQLVVYDNHNLIYVYGDLSKIEAQLKELGFEEGLVRIPAPHAHLYNVENDKYETEIMNYWKWVKFPLGEQDNP